MTKFTKITQGFFSKLAHLFSPYFDKKFLHSNVPLSTIVSHSNWESYLVSIGNKKNFKILEIGSREVTGRSRARQLFSEATYIGFDYYIGDNVDVVGDAHKLSSYFKEGEKFDLIYSSACFEHFAMPWLVAQETAKLLKVGGIVFVETHFAFSSHERPWHFFHYTDMALKVLFSKALGFEVIECGFSNPVVGRFSAYADKYLQYRKMKGLYCHVEYLGRKITEVENFSWVDVNLEDVVGDTKYPDPSTVVIKY